MKNIALIHAAVMFYNMVIVDIYAYKALHGPQVNQEALIGLANAKLIASIVYGYFTFFPFVVVKRYVLVAHLLSAVNSQSLLTIGVHHCHEALPRRYSLCISGS